MHIVIPTRGRAHDQPALRMIKGAGFIPILVGNSLGDVPRDVSKLDFDIFPHDNVGQVRQYIIDNYGPKVIIIDDDIRIHQRKEDGMFRRATPEEVRLFVQRVALELGQYTMVGVAARFMGQHNPRDHMINKRVGGVMGINVPELKGARFRLANSEDTDFQLQVMLNGDQVKVLTEWAMDDKGKYREGGCATYRPHQNCEAEQESAEMMKALWPGIVTTDKRGQLRIAWRKFA